MLIPATALFIISFAWPMVLVGRLSLFKSDYVTSQFVALQNYSTAFTDRYFIKSFVNSFWFLLMTCPLLLVASYKITSLLSDFNEKVQSAGRFILYIPALASGLIMGLLWEWLLLRNGLINSVLSLIGIGGVPWLSEAWPARISISLISAIAWLGGNVILFSSSMHSIPKELKDASIVDGASRGQYKRYIVLPLMIPTLTLALLLSITGVMTIWETIYVLTEGGGPEGSTATPVYEIFMTAFRFGKHGLAAAKGVILMIVVGVILLIKQRIEKWVGSST
jgi:ABC-type sugar transport system permease subunit